ncbi:S-adenosylmethionine synthetase-like protein [Anaeromyxobacter sp. K]|nr:S-adenosylmethionine synthetase-like protein [Anaeromyxobacter sp. K]
MVNPNGRLLNGGNDGDNGQTGRKLVMDYYGPHVTIGGGALCGKHLTHIDRSAPAPRVSRPCGPSRTAPPSASSASRTRPT